MEKKILESSNQLFSTPENLSSLCKLAAQILFSMCRMTPSLRIFTRAIGSFVVASIVIPCCRESAIAQTLKPSVREFVNEHCVSCHNPEKKKGKLDLESILKMPISDHHETWSDVAWMLKEREMPPEDAKDARRPSDSEYQENAAWFKAALAPFESAESPSADAMQPTDMVSEFCVSCHNPEENKGQLDLESIQAEPWTAHPEVWEKVITRLLGRQMPPPDRERPSETVYEGVLSTLTQALDTHAAKEPQPGRVETFRRMNRTEYQNSIRDLLGVEVDAASFLPQDEESHGFDNVTVGTLSPSLVDRYITAAQRISRLAIGTPPRRPDGYTYRIPPDFTQEKHVPGLPLGTRGGALLNYTFPQDGEYEIEVLLSRDRNEHVEGLNGTHQMEILLDRALVEDFEVTRKGHESHSEVDKHLKTRTRITAGPHDIGVTFRQKSYSLLENKRKPFAAHFNLHRHPRLSPAIYQISITGPFTAEGAGMTPSRKRIFVDYPKDTTDEQRAAETILAHLMKRAFRRPITKEDVDKRLAFYHEGRQSGDFEAGIKRALESILVSPEFLFRIEREPKSVPPGGVYQISDIELASRLSFFIWSSLPDEELLDLAIANRLSRNETLSEQVHRMLKDPRSQSLVDNFASQWLHLRNLDGVTPDLRLFPDFDHNLRTAFRQETELFISSILREDRSILDLLKADYTYLNERLAHHYNIPGIFGSRFRRVSLDPKYNRGGLLRQGSILTVTSYATRTSPVIRGNWVLENILGTPAPPPPPNVPALEDNKVDASLPMRERLAEHRANPACASCHNLMDPVGFALENFDAVGRWRQFENGAPIDVSGGLPDGRVFSGIHNLEKGLLERPELFVHTLTKKLMIFALGRGVDAHDSPAIRQIVAEAKAADFRLSSIVLGIAKSLPFQMRVKSNEETEH